MAFRRFFILGVLAIGCSCSYLPEGHEISEFVNLKQETGDYLLLSLSENIPEKALLFVPGGLVDPHVYLCWMDRFVEVHPEIAIISLKIPSNLAIINQGKAGKIVAKFPDVKHWAIGGHSLGGTVSASIINKSPDQFDALVLLASWTTSYADLSSWNGNVLSIYASNDAVASADEIEGNKGFLPESVPLEQDLIFGPLGGKTFYYEIEGGNHSGFGCYGAQEGDSTASITSFEQQEIMIAVLEKFLNELW